jgi:hypothetical protein
MPDDRNENFLRQISFISDSDANEMQKYVDDFLIFLKRRRVNPEDIVWSYETFLEVDEKIKIKINLPNNLPLIGSVTSTGIIVSNDPDLQMRVRNFTTIQIDKTIKIIKRSESYLSIYKILEELENLISIIKSSLQF